MAQSRKAPPRIAEVKQTRRITPNMLRVTFSGDALLGFPTNAASANIKLLLPHAHQDEPTYLASLLGEGEKPIKRTYTVVEYRKTSNELDIDFAMHADAESGPATRFALNAKAGDKVGIAGPSGLKLVDAAADWFLIAGDMTALPAIEANTKHLPKNATGFIVIEVQDISDKRIFDLPDNINIQWLINPEPHSEKSLLAITVMNLHWLEGTPNVWVAGESSIVRELRSYFAKDKQLDREHRYTSGYWIIGQNEDAFQMVKRQEMGS